MIQRRLKEINIRNKWGIKIKVEAYKISRSETSEAWDIYLKRKGRWITPFEIRVRKLDLGTEYINLMLFALYGGDNLQWLVYKNNPFLSLIKKDYNAGSKYF